MAMKLPKKRSKYNAKKTRVGALVFDSEKEAARWGVLVILEKQGRIKSLERQIPYTFVVNGVKICTYRLDFRYIDGVRTVYEDCKGVRTQVYNLKKKLMRALYGITILET